MAFEMSGLFHDAILQFHFFFFFFLVIKQKCKGSWTHDLTLYTLLLPEDEAPSYYFTIWERVV